MGEITLVKLLEKIKEMPPLPQSVTQILEISKSTKSSAQDPGKSV